MGLDNAGHNVVSAGEPCPPGEQHLIGFADAWGSAEKDLQAAAAGLLAAGKFKQGFRRGATDLIGFLHRHTLLKRTIGSKRQGHYNPKRRLGRSLGTSRSVVST